jgi:hypothetical protein
MSAERRPVVIRPDDFRRHAYISGATQYGKSTLMHSLIYQLMRDGEGIIVLDAKGDLVPKLLHWVPSFRRDDVIHLDLTNPIALDFMACESDDEIDVLIDDIIQMFERIAPGWGGKMEGIVRHAVLTLLLCGKPTFLDLYRILTDKKFRNDLTKDPAIQNHPALNNFWQEEADKILKSESATAIVFSRMSKFALSPRFQKILGTPGGLNIERAINSKKIIFVNLRGAGDQAMVYGSMLVSKIQQVVLRRDPDKEEPVPVHLYIDEFQDFKPAGFEKLLAKAGGLGLYFTLCNQYFDQIKDSDVRTAIINCVQTYFLFNMGTKNAGEIADKLTDKPTPDPIPVVQPVREGRPIQDIRANLKFWKAREAYFENIGGAEWGDAWQQVRAIESELEEAKKPLPKMPKPIPPKKPPTYLEQLPSLAPGRCVYRAANGWTGIIKTIKAPPLEKVGKTSHAEYIKKHTLDEAGKAARYAEESQKRSGDKSAGNSPPVPDNKGNGKKENIASSGPARIRVD